jgi:hypothetical protein
MAASPITIRPDITPDELRRLLDRQPDNKFIHVTHGPAEPETSNLIVMARKDPQARTCLIELAKAGFYVYVAKEGASRLVRSDNLKNLWLKVRDNEFQLTEDEVVYTYTPPEERPAARMLVVLSSITDNVNSPSLQRYFMQNFPTIQKYMPSDTAVLRVGDLGGVMGSFYLNTTHRPDNVGAVQRLIEAQRIQHGFSHDSVVLYGVSKGATAALYHGLVGSYRFVAVDPIISDDHYVKHLRDAHFTVGGVFPETKDVAFDKLLDRIAASPAAPGSPVRASVICSERSPQFPYIKRALIDRFSDRMSFFNASNPLINDHPDVGPKTVNCATMLMSMHLYGMSPAPGVLNIG